MPSQALPMNINPVGGGLLCDLLHFSCLSSVKNVVYRLNCEIRIMLHMHEMGVV